MHLSAIGERKKICSPSSPPPPPMESVAIATTSRSLPLPFSSTPLHRRLRRRASLLPVAASKRRSDEEDEEVAHGRRPSGPAGREPTSLAPYGLSVSPFSKDAAMGLVMSAATGSGWTTGSGMEGPPKAVGADQPEVSTLPWSLFTKSPRRRMRVAFTCNVCGQRTTRAINPHAYTDGTVFVQCCGCNVFHKLVDNLNLFHEMKCYVGPDFRYEGDAPFNYLDGNEDGDNIFPVL